MAAAPSLSSILMQAGLQAERVSKDFFVLVDIGDWLSQVQSVLLSSASSQASAQTQYGTQLSLVNQVCGPLLPATLCGPCDVPTSPPAAAQAWSAYNVSLLYYGVFGAPRLTGVRLRCPGCLMGCEALCLCWAD
jgi:hypothetical protein